jgi:hypothetical protein
MAPGTLCLATIMLSLREKIHPTSKLSALEDFLQEIAKRRPPNEHTMSSARQKSKDVLDACLL